MVHQQADCPVFPERLKELMENHNGRRVSQQQLAEAVGVKRQAISQYLEGSVQPVISKLSSIAKFFNVSSDWLLGLSKTKSLMYNGLHQKIGISEKALELLCEHYSTPYTKEPLEFLLSSRDFYSVIKAMAYLAKVYVDPDSAHDILRIAAAKYLVNNEFNSLIDHSFPQQVEHTCVPTAIPECPFLSEEVMKNV